MSDRAREREQEQGFLLLGLIVAIFIILLTLSVAAPKMARELRREREVETVHRGNQYVRAIQLYYRKFGHYPGSMEQLNNTNAIRFLRQNYIDPLTGKADWRIIKVGENKTTVKGFFGKPLAGLPTAGLGSAAGMASSFGSSGTAPTTSPGAAFGSSGSVGSPLGGSSSPTSGLGMSGVGLSSSSTSGSNTAGGPAAYGTSGSSSSPGGTQSTSSSGSIGGGGPFVGVGLVRDGDSIITLNEQTTYNTWEFIYDPRIEQLKAKAAMMGGGATGFGTSSGSGSSAFGGSNSTGFGNSTSPSSNGTSTPPPANPNPQ